MVVCEVYGVLQGVCDGVQGDRCIVGCMVLGRVYGVE
jgi:hypothetical protein